MYHGKTPFSRKNPQTFTERDAAEVHKAIERGMDWLGKSKENKADGYYLYGTERAGVASGRKLSGGADWFARGALEILQAQARDGSITLGNWGGTPGRPRNAPPGFGEDGFDGCFLMRGEPLE